MRWTILKNGLLMLTIVGLAVGLILAFADAPRGDAPLTDVAKIYTARTVEETTVTSVVAAINFDWRAYDTLGESTILLTAATGVGLLMRRYLLRRRETGMS